VVLQHWFAGGPETMLSLESLLQFLGPSGRRWGVGGASSPRFAHINGKIPAGSRILQKERWAHQLQGMRVFEHRWAPVMFMGAAQPLPVLVSWRGGGLMDAPP
jgi:hypothetical protein